MGQGNSYSKLEDRYHVQKIKLGTGNFGTVWRAVDKGSNAIVAVKQLDKSAIAQRGIKREDVEREIAMMKSCVHEHIIRLLDIFVDKSSIYLILELCEGGDFGDKIKERGRNIQDEEAGAWMLQVLSAIAALHYKSICHRDIKPDNFMLSGNTLKLADFGIAVPVQRGQLLVDKCGTPAFMAPEQHLLPKQSQGYSFPVDLWAAGILMYMLMENRHPFLNAKGKLEEEQLMNGQLNFSGRGSKGFFREFSFSLDDLRSFSLDRFLCSEDSQDRFSNAARRFCRCLVCPNPATRFTAKAALHEPWLTREDYSTYKPAQVQEETAQLGPRSRPRIEGAWQASEEATREETIWCMPQARKERKACGAGRAACGADWALREIPAPDEQPDGWVWHKSPEGHVFWHHTSLGPAPWDTPEKFPGVKSTAEPSRSTTAQTKTPQSQMKVPPQKRAGSPEPSQNTLFHSPWDIPEKFPGVKSTAEPSQSRTAQTKTPQSQVKVPSKKQAASPEPSQITPVPTKTTQHQMMVPSRSQKVAPEMQKQRSRSAPEIKVAPPPPPDSPPPESHESHARSNRYNDSKYVNLTPAMFAD